MPVPPVAVTRPAPDDALPLLVLGPSLGTSADSIWGPCLPVLTSSFDVIAWDLPGHGRSGPAGADFTMSELAEGVLAAVAPALAGRTRYHYAGDSVGGAVGLHLLLDHPDRIEAATLLCTGARIGEPAGWEERAATVLARGTAAVVDSSRQRWFGPGFTEREPARAEALLDALRGALPTDYARVCHALAGHDVRDRLAEITSPVLAVAGDADQPTPVALLEEVSQGVKNGRLVVLDGVAHLAPAEDPERVVGLIRDHHGR
jgi:3-oxoadipate enol-lactonase